MNIHYALAEHGSLVPLRIGINLSFDELSSSYAETLYDELALRLKNLFDLKITSSDDHEHGIKAVIKGKSFDCLRDVSAPTRIFMLLHTLGHYYFISRAARIGIDRYDYIYETSENGDAHVYRYKAAGNGSPVVTAKILADRIEFEVRANDFAVELAKSIGFPHLVPLIRLYEPADIRYIIDVMDGGPEAILSDREYVEKYVLSGLGVPQQDNQENIFDLENFILEDVDWELIERRKIEIHFL